jgi:hypothetical protein
MPHDDQYHDSAENPQNPNHAISRKMKLLEENDRISVKAEGKWKTADIR